MVEVNISIVILAICVLGAASTFVYFSKISAKIMHTQNVQNRVDTLLASFKVQSTCNQLVRGVFGQLPYRVYSTLFTFSSIEIDGVPLDINGKSASLPDFPLGQIHEIELNLDGTPLASQVVARAELVVTYGLANSTRLLKRSSLIFFELDHNGDIRSCLDSASYAAIEWADEGCRRMGGVLKSQNGKQQCDLSGSSFLKNQTCSSMSLVKQGNRCVVKTQ